MKKYLLVIDVEQRNEVFIDPQLAQETAEKIKEALERNGWRAKLRIQEIASPEAEESKDDAPDELPF